MIYPAHILTYRQYEFPIALTLPQIQKNLLVRVASFHETTIRDEAGEEFVVRQLPEHTSETSVDVLSAGAFSVRSENASTQPSLTCFR